MADRSLADRLDRRIATDGPIPVSAYVEAALYDPDGGFYTAGGGRAGRRGDFLTAPEVGPLFGAVVAGAVDEWWVAAGRPPQFVVEEWGAGPGTLARSVVAADPAALRTGALRWVQVEVSAAQRAQHLDHPSLTSRAPDEPDPPPDVILANELLDNLPFDIVERVADGWREVLVDRRDHTGRFTTVLGDATGGPGVDAPVGTRLPVVAAAIDWIEAARKRAGRVVVFDYGADRVDLTGRDGRWLRTHAAHAGEADWLQDPGSCDITTDLPVDALPRPTSATTQAGWLRAQGIEVLVEEGRRVWTAGAGVGDLAALRARSRIREAEALLDPGGMGAFHVLEWLNG